MDQPQTLRHVNFQDAVSVSVPNAVAAFGGMTSLHGSTVASVVRHKQKRQQNRSLTNSRAGGSISGGGPGCSGIGTTGGSSGGGGTGATGVDRRRSTLSLHNANARHYPARPLLSDADRTLTALASNRGLTGPEADTQQQQQFGEINMPSNASSRRTNSFIKPSILIMGCAEGAIQSGDTPVDVEPYPRTNSAALFATSNASHHANSIATTTGAMYNSWTCPVGSTPSSGAATDGPLHFTFTLPNQSMVCTSAAAAPYCSSSGALPTVATDYYAPTACAMLPTSATSGSGSALHLQNTLDSRARSSLDLRPPNANYSSFPLRSGASAAALRNIDQQRDTQQYEPANEYAYGHTDMEERSANAAAVRLRAQYAGSPQLMHKTCTDPQSLECAGPQTGTIAQEAAFGEVMPLGQRPTGFYRGRAYEAIPGRRKSASFDANTIPGGANSRHYQQPHCLLRFSIGGHDDVVSEVAECDWVDLDRNAEMAGYAPETSALLARAMTLDRAIRQSTVSLIDDPRSHLYLHHQQHLGSPELVAPASTPVASPTAVKHPKTNPDEDPTTATATTPNEPPYAPPPQSTGSQSQAASSLAPRMSFREQITNIFQSTMLEHNRPATRRRHLQRLRHLPQDSAVASVSSSVPGGTVPGGDALAPGAGATGAQSVDGKTAAEADAFDEELDPRKFCLLIHPNSAFRFYWDMCMLLLLIANVIVLPVAISFFADELFEPTFLVFNIISDVFFLLDILFNFRTGLILKERGDQVVMEPRSIAVHYLRTWFTLDLLSSMPMDYFVVLFMHTYHRRDADSFLNAGKALRALRLVKLLSLLRLLRISRLVRYVSQWEENIENAQPGAKEGKFLQILNLAGVFIRVLNLVMLILLLGHWNACLQFLVPTLRDLPDDCWVIIEELREKPWLEQYTWALFKTLSHMLCIGYGRSAPQGLSDAWLTMISMLIGAICYALFVGHATNLIQSFDSSKRLYREKRKQIEEYMCYKKLPRPLRQKILRYYEHRYRGKMFNEDEILSELSDCLREQVINFNCRSLVAAVPFFANADPEFVSDVVSKLRFEVFQPGDLVVKEGTLGTRMYFIQEGIVDVLKVDGQIITSLGDGSFFGEICLLAKTRRVASVKAATYCNLYSLDSEHFEEVLDKYPLMRRTIELVATERLNKIGQSTKLLNVGSGGESERQPENAADSEHVTQMVRAIAENEQHSVQQRKSRMYSVVGPGGIVAGSSLLGTSWGSGAPAYGLNGFSGVFGPPSPGSAFLTPMGNASPNPGNGMGHQHHHEPLHEHEPLVFTRSLNAAPSGGADLRFPLQQSQQQQQQSPTQQQRPNTEEQQELDNKSGQTLSLGTSASFTGSTIEPGNGPGGGATSGLSPALPASNSGQNLQSSAALLPQSGSNESCTIAAANKPQALSPSSSSAALGSSAGSGLLAAAAPQPSPSPSLSVSASGSGSGGAGSGLLRVKRSTRRRKSFTEALFGPAHNGSSDEEAVDYTVSPPPLAAPATPIPAHSPLHVHSQLPAPSQGPSVSFSPSPSPSPGPGSSTNILTGCVGGGGGSGSSSAKKHKSGGGGVGGLVSMSEAAFLAARATATLVAASIDSASRPLDCSSNAASKSASKKH